MIQNLKDNFMVSYKVKYSIAIQSSSSIPKYLTDLKTYLHENLHSKVSSHLIIITRNCNQSRCPSIGEWYIYPMEYYSAIKINEL